MNAASEREARHRASRSTTECPLCQRQTVNRLVRVEGRDYWACPACEMRFLDPSCHPTREVEYAHYLNHRNDVADPGYRQFLSKLADPLIERLMPQSRGLDYGCGPGPALAAMLREAGHQVELYDPFFHPGEDALRSTYDFVTCTETAEHFHRPGNEFARLMSIVRPGGWLAIMTCFQTDDERFEKWHYRQDPTHVAFYREATFRWLAQQHGWFCDIPRKDVALLQRPDD